VTKKQKQSETTTTAKGTPAEKASDSASDTSRNAEETEAEELESEGSESDGLESEEDEEGEQPADDTTDRDVLIALGELDAEAAEAYRIVADGIDDPAIRAKLEEFAQDHQRHVDSINALLSAGDGEGVISTDLDEGSSSITMLAAAMDGMGDRAALLTMIGNEQLTNSAYPIALELPFEEDVLRVLQRNAADEERHLSWLLGQEKRMRESGAEVGLEG